MCFVPTTEGWFISPQEGFGMVSKISSNVPLKDQCIRQGEFCQERSTLELVSEFPIGEAVGVAGTVDELVRSGRF